MEKCQGPIWRAGLVGRPRCGKEFINGMLNGGGVTNNQQPEISFGMGCNQRSAA
jgi:hypothetical protein